MKVKLLVLVVTCYVPSSLLTYLTNFLLFQESAGVTDNLTDEDIKMALWYLSVNDLITLNKLIDLEKQFPYDYNDER